MILPSLVPGSSTGFSAKNFSTAAAADVMLAAAMPSSKIQSRLIKGHNHHKASVGVRLQLQHVFLDVSRRFLSFLVP